MKIRENVKLSELTTMRLGGEARFVLDVEEPDEVRGAYTFAREKNLPVFILGSGANTLGHDSGFNGVIIRNRILGIQLVASRSDTTVNTTLDLPDEITDTLEFLRPDETLWRVYGGEIWDDFVTRVAADGYTGIETLAAIPSTVGAAPVQNIGAYGHDVSETITAVEVYDTLDSEYKIIFADELDFSYRRSIFNSTHAGRYFIVSVFFRLRKGTLMDAPTPSSGPTTVSQPTASPAPLYKSLQTYLDENAITDRSPATIAAAVTAIRADKLPDPAKIASSGSFFKNVYVSDELADALEAKGAPVYRRPSQNKVNTGWLIEHSGLLGQDLHGFRINDKAALVLINDHATSYSDLAAARDEIRQAVYEKFGVEIEQEPVEIVATPPTSTVASSTHTSSSESVTKSAALEPSIDPKSPEEPTND